MTIFWYDIETNGLDLDGGAILEIGYVMTTNRLAMLCEGEIVIHPAQEIREMRRMAPQVVRDMHDVNGLWDECDASDIYLEDAEEILLDQIHRHAESGLVIPGGSGVSHFDNRWVEALMPGVFEHFRHFSYDVGVVRRFMELNAVAGPPAGDRRPHRGLDDTKAAIEQWRWYSSLMDAAVTE